ncbi:hypothetical protein SAMN02745248_01493 [Hathewaya proteolytica DSM 3090]|uniref:Phosphoesterase n=1 Tax=Hathewaya proteolytica DSM 3090 TaxID=1121331 RepID=A0A1M6NUE0_9CLOT|nr:metallophosphoesterase [Hathewaya proteolytica]SHJ99224.1 hypothetical protein SAMN02745248_01493 [Hathewaya proteolytica DSM 3090]
MIISIISDTHRDIESMRKSLDMVKKSNTIIHLGDNVEDVEFYKRNFSEAIFYVKGNCDLGSKIKTEEIIEMCGKRIFITHGHNYNVKYGLLNLKYKAMQEDANIVLYGHTHKAEITFEQGIWFINPGSLCKPLYGNRSFATIGIRDSKIIPYINEVK